MLLGAQHVLELVHERARVSALVLALAVDEVVEEPQHLARVALRSSDELVDEGQRGHKGRHRAHGVAAVDATRRVDAELAHVRDQRLTGSLGACASLAGARRGCWGSCQRRRDNEAAKRRRGVRERLRVLEDAARQVRRRGQRRHDGNGLLGLRRRRRSGRSLRNRRKSPLCSPHPGERRGQGGRREVRGGGSRRRGAGGAAGGSAAAAAAPSAAYERRARGHSRSETQGVF